MILKDSKSRCHLYPLIAADGLRQRKREKVGEEETRVNTLSIALSPALPIDLSCVARPVCVVGREVTRAMEAEGEQGD